MPRVTFQVPSGWQRRNSGNLPSSRIGALPGGALVIEWAMHEYARSSRTTTSSVWSRKSVIGGQTRSAARRRLGQARGDRALKLPGPSSAEESAGCLVLDQALARLEVVDPDAAVVVRLRYFSGLGVEETAAALGSSPATVKRPWAFARGWLEDALESAGA